MSRQSEIDNLAEGIIYTIDCSCCGLETASYGEEVADIAFDKGWRVKEGHTYCPDCIKKRKHLKK